jgi:hypothetical protein
LFGVSGGVQPKTQVVELNDRFVERNVSRLLNAGRLSTGFLNPIVHAESTAIDT